MYCEHAMDTPVEYLVRETGGCAICPDCAAHCKICGRTFHIDRLSNDGLCEECLITEEGTGMTEQQERSDLLAAKKLHELAAAEEEMETLRQKREKLEAEANECAIKIAGIRDTLCDIVEKSGGVLDVEGLSRPLVVRRRRSFVYDDETLEKWLLGNAPNFLTRSEVMRVDRRGLRNAVSVRNGRAYLPGKRGPIRGVGIRESICIAIPGGAPDEVD